MDKDLNNYYKTCDFINLSNKEKMFKNEDDYYGYNIDSIKRKSMNCDFSKKRTFINKEFINNNKIR